MGKTIHIAEAMNSTAQKTDIKRKLDLSLSPVKEPAPTKTLVFSNVSTGEKDKKLTPGNTTEHPVEMEDVRDPGDNTNMEKVIDGLGLSDLEVVSKFLTSPSPTNKTIDTPVSEVIATTLANNPVKVILKELLDNAMLSKRDSKGKRQESLDESKNGNINQPSSEDKLISRLD